jgi:TMEM175 potassium channel family protein
VASDVKQRAENEVEFSRIVAFSDGVFAIAITLLVLQLEVPQQGDLGRELWDQRQDVFAYALSFAVVGRFWLVHHRFFGEVIRFDGRLIALNLLYLAWIVLMPFSSEVLGDHGSAEAAIVLYAVNLAGVVLFGALMFSYAQRAGLTRTSPRQARENQRRALTIAAIFAVSIPIAFVNPHVASYCWLALFLPAPAERLARRRRAP